MSPSVALLRGQVWSNLGITQWCIFLSQEVREKRPHFCCAAARVSPLPLREIMREIQNRVPSYTKTLNNACHPSIFVAARQKIKDQTKPRAALFCFSQIVDLFFQTSHYFEFGAKVVLAISIEAQLFWLIGFGLN